MKLIDTHAHLYADAFDTDRVAMLSRAMEVNEAIYLPNIDEGSIALMHSLVEAYPGFLFPMMGLHPCYVPEDYEGLLDKMEGLLREGSYAGVGETGIDLYWDKSTFERQKSSLLRHIAWAKEFRLPVILHARNAIDETYELIAEHHDEGLRGIFHCFDGTAEQAERICKLGSFKLGIGGALTYHKTLPQVLGSIDLAYIVLETDSPYLAPVPHRRARNESAYIRFVAEKVAEIYGLKYAEVAAKTTENAREVFGGMK